jgi:hypothetical protein
MNRKIKAVETSDIFWNDLKGLRKESWYADIRKSIAKFVTDLAKGLPVRERGFSNPNLKGVMHVGLPKDMRLFHVYPDDSVLRLCLVADHRVYGFKGKNKSKEASTANRVWRSAEGEVVQSPKWDDIKWKNPADLVDNPELNEMSIKGLHDINVSLNAEIDDFQLLIRFAKVPTVNEVPDKVLGPWLEDLVSAQESVIDAMDLVCKRRRKPLVIEDFQCWMEL